MKLEKLIDTLSDCLQDAANEDEENGQGTLSAKYEPENEAYTIDLFYYKKKGKWLCEVTIYHYNGDDERESPNLKKFLENELEGCVDWAVAEDCWREASMDEWEAHGFRDEADYNRWRFGDPRRWR